MRNAVMIWIIKQQKCTTKFSGFGLPSLDADGDCLARMHWTGLRRHVQQVPFTTTIMLRKERSLGKDCFEGEVATVVGAWLCRSRGIYIHISIAVADTIYIYSTAYFYSTVFYIPVSFSIAGRKKNYFCAICCTGTGSVSVLRFRFQFTERV